MHDSSLSQVIFEQFLTKLDLISQKQKLVLQMGQHFLQLVFPAPKYLYRVIDIKPQMQTIYLPEHLIFQPPHSLYILNYNLIQYSCQMRDCHTIIGHWHILLPRSVNPRKHIIPVKHTRTALDNQIILR